MASDKSSSSRVAALLFLAFACVAGWFLAPQFAPMYRWLEVDFEIMAAEAKVPLAELEQKQSYRFYYNPRGKDDPLPWQLMIGSNYKPPSWEIDPKTKNLADEYNMLVRVDLVSDRTGESPGTLMKGGAYYDNLFRGQAWRLPAGSLGKGHTRPVVLLDGSSWKKLSIGEAKPLVQSLRRDLRRQKWITDEDPENGFDWRKDAYVPPDPKAEKLEAEAEAEAEGAESASPDTDAAASE